MRCGLRNSEQKPSRNRSSAERLGARRRERLITRSCCFMSRLSATTALAPPGPRSLAIVVNRWARSTSRSFMAEQGKEDCYQEQVCLSRRFQVIISNSLRTGTRLSKLWNLANNHWVLYTHCQIICSYAAETGYIGTCINIQVEV